ncbi:hypothetical protein HDK90DRAFT_497256 [Phyllosticta capitalensis]|uniref:Secreted protein n=1 Tax=Phyllosticta capitalensis TaxID=121624 RepID=A0ABR1YCP8_9PEZI
MACELLLLALAFTPGQAVDLLDLLDSLASVVHPLHGRLLLCVARGDLRRRFFTFLGSGVAQGVLMYFIQQHPSQS